MQINPRVIPFLAVAGMFACGGSINDKAAGVSITISPSVMTVPAGAAQQFTATVTGSSNTAVTWALDEGDSGSIDANGLYTAAATLGDFHVTAISLADPSKKGGASISVKGGLRTVRGTFSTVFTKDDGTQVTVPGVNTTEGGGTPDAIVFRNGGGFTSVPLTVAADGSFAVPNVPGGTYYLQTEQVSFPTNVAGQQSQSILVTLNPLTSDTPDLSTALHGRPDAVVATGPTPVTLNVTNLSPWAASAPFRDRLLIGAPQALGDEDVFELGPQPAAGTTSITQTFDWQVNLFDGFTQFLPDASKGDTTYIYHRTALAMPNGCGGTLTKRFAKSNTFTVPQGGGVTASFELQDAPLSETLSTAASLSKFAALVPQMNPAASLVEDPGFLTFPSAGAALFAIPQSISYPDFPGLSSMVRVFSYNYFGSLSADTDCGTVGYGGFLDKPFHTMRNFAFEAGVILQADGGSVGMNPLFVAQEDANNVANALEPKIGPVAAPRINGKDAFVAQTSVGLSPALSWSAPAFGSASDYTVNIQMISVPDSESDIGQIIAGVHGSTSFTVPPGLLKAGKTYAAIITAADAPSHDPNRPFRFGLPFYSADAVTNTFTP
jgi:hypothetical protein